MEPTEGSETSAALKLTPGKYPKEDIQLVTTCLMIFMLIMYGEGGIKHSKKNQTHVERGKSDKSVRQKYVKHRRILQ
jgi:hypothetical protein